MMQRKPTKNTRGPNAEEKRFLAWVKEQPCCCCGSHAPSIAHHCQGSTFKHNKVLIGHWFIIPLCSECDEIDTQGSHKAFRERFGPQSERWYGLIERYEPRPPQEVIDAVMDWKR